MAMAAVTQQPPSQSELLFLLGKVPAHSFEPAFYATRNGRQTQKLHSELCGLLMQSVRRKHFHELQILQKKIPLLNIFWLCTYSYLALLQSVPPSLWRGPCRQWELHFVSWGMTVLRAGLKRVELHVQRRSKPTLDP